MYGLDVDTDISFLLGKELLQIGIGRFGVGLDFVKDVSIYIECRFEMISQGHLEETAELPMAACPLLRLLGAKVSKVDIRENGTLQVGFSSGDILKVYDSNPDTESYTITWGTNGSIVV
jgi:hypothetical protein